MDDTSTRRDWTEPAIYRVTFSNVSTVRQGLLIIDEDNGDEVRSWTLLDIKTGETNKGWMGVRLYQLCPKCLDLSKQLIRVLGHTHPHGEGDELDFPS